MTDATTPMTVRFGRLPRRGLLLGLSASRILCLCVAVLVFVPAIFLGSATGAGLTAPLWGGLIALAFVRWHGRPAVESLPTAGHFVTRKLNGQSKFRVRPSMPRPGGTLALPGDAAALRFFADEESGVAMLHDPHAHTLTAVALVKHPAYVLLSSDEQARRVHGWGRALASLAASGTGCRLQVLEVSLPDAGRGLTGWWDVNGVKQPGQWPVQQYESLMKTAAPADSTHRTLIALSLDLRSARAHIKQAGRGMRGAAAFLRQEMTSFEAGLRAADLSLATWFNESELAATVREAFEPGHPSTDREYRTLAGAGPVAMDEEWGHVRHDTAYSAVLWINEWPRVGAPPYFLHSLVFQAGIRKTISLTIQPIPADVAMRDIRKAKVEYATEAAQKAKIGAIADLSDGAEHDDVIERERALISGHADVKLTGLISVTAPSLDELEASVAEISRAAIQCGCETRRLYGQQARAFVSASLPLARKVSR